MKIVPPPGKAALLAFTLGAVLLAFGSIIAIPRSWPGQVVLSVFTGALFVTVGALRLSLLLAFRPHHVDDLLGGAEASAPVPSFRDFPGLRWTLALALFAVALGAALVIAGDVHAWSRMRWAMPAGTGWLVLG